MKNKVELLAERDHLVLSMDDLVNKAKRDVRPLTIEERASIDEFEKTIDGIDARVAEIAASDLAVERVNALMKGRKTPEKRLTDPIEPSGGLAVPSDVRIRVRPPIHGKLQSFTGPNAEEDAYESGQWCRAALFNDEVARRWCNNHGVETRSAIESNNLYGGALVPDAFSQTIINLQEQYGVIRQEAQVFPMSSDHIDVPIHKTGISATWSTEGVAPTDTQSEWETLGLTAKKLSCLVKISTELAEDSVIDLADFMAGQMARAFAKAEDDAAFKGDGSNTYGGIYGWTSIERLNVTALAGAIDTPSAADVFTAITVADLDALMGLLPQYADPNAKFYCSKYAYVASFQALAAAAGGNTVQTLQGKFGKNWMGYPIVETPSMPNASSPAADLTDYIMMIYGDMRQACAFGDRRMFTLKILDQLYAAEDMIGVKATERVDIVNHGYGDNTTASAMVGLIGT